MARAGQSTRDVCMSMCEGNFITFAQCSCKFKECKMKKRAYLLLETEDACSADGFSPTASFYLPSVLTCLRVLFVFSAAFEAEKMMNTTRKPEKSNGITDGIFPSVIYTDGHNSVSKSVGRYRRNHSIGDTVGFTDGIYISSANTQRHGDVRQFYRRKVPRDSNCDSRTVTW